MICRMSCMFIFSMRSFLSLSFLRAYRTVLGLQWVFFTRSLWVIAPSLPRILSTIFDDGGNGFILLKGFCGNGSAAAGPATFLLSSVRRILVCKDLGERFFHKIVNRLHRSPGFRTVGIGNERV